MNEKQKQQIIKSLSIGHLTNFQQDKIIGMVLENVSAKLDIIIWNAFLTEEKKKLYSASKIGESKKVLRYIISKIGNFNQLVEDTTRETIKDFKAKRRNISTP